ncbi:MAG: aspartate carbamoyltransferase regulatory subunit, partial [Bacillota bacterium]|nr:aspartate carbamoyltransferase regulatory subunit [Bacillota bacterium]
MIIGKIENGIVLDHIRAGEGMKLYQILGLGDLNDCQVALIKNAESPKMGRKDIIKIDKLIDINL